MDKPLILNYVKGSNIGSRKASLYWPKEPILPGKTFEVELVMSADETCAKVTSKYNDMSITMSSNASKEAALFRARWNRIQVKLTDEECKKRSQEATHNILFVAEIATAFIPVVGPFISSGIAMYDAKLYYDEGDKETAGLFAVLTAIPVAGPIAKKIPGVKQLGAKGMNTLGKKFTAKGTLKSGKTLTSTEKSVISGLNKNKSFVKTELNNYVKKKAATLSSKVSKATVKKQLGNIAKTGLTYGGTTVAYKATYAKTAESGALGLNEYLKTKGYQKEDFKTVKTLFGSSGSGSDNEKLIQAMKNGWKPGEIVPAEYRTSVYSAQLKEDTERITNLENKLKELGYA